MHVSLPFYAALMILCIISLSVNRKVSVLISISVSSDFVTGIDNQNLLAILLITPLQLIIGGVFSRLYTVYGESSRFSLCVFFSVCLSEYPVCYTSTKSWRGYIFTAVCLCVCLSVCVRYFLVNKIPIERMNRFRRCFHYMVAYRTGSNPIEIGDLGSKVKVTVT